MSKVGINLSPSSGQVANLFLPQRICRIAREHDLDTDGKEQIPMFIEDVVPLTETTLRTMEKQFDLGLQRMQQCLYPLMACFTVNWINANASSSVLASTVFNPTGSSWSFSTCKEYTTYTLIRKYQPRDS
jgi:hypothetical protein